MDELLKPMTQKTAISVESLTAEVQETIASAKAKGQNAIVLKGVELAAKLHGMLRERVDVVHEIGVDRESILVGLGKKYGAEVETMMREALGAPPVIEPKFVRIAQSRRVDETSAELTAGLMADTKPD
jgi:hypothetical protein